jgi:hypothetical protein
MGEPARGLGQREARAQPVADRVAGGRDAGVEPIMGGFLLLYVTGAGKYSVDARIGAAKSPPR